MIMILYFVCIYNVMIIIRFLYSIYFIFYYFFSYNYPICIALPMFYVL